MQAKNWLNGIDPRLEILPNPGGGDCLFYAVQQATGIPVRDLKRSVSDMASEEEFWVKKAMYDSAKKGLVSDAETTTIAAEYARDYLDYAWLEDIRNLRDYRAALAKRGTWGDGESVQHLERFLRCRMLILCEDTGGAFFVPGVGGGGPRFYLLINYRAGHFELVTFSGCGMLADVPPLVKRMLNDRKRVPPRAADLERQTSSVRPEA